MDIGGRIQQLRKEKGMTQELLAGEMGVSITAVSKWENNVSHPDVLILCALAEYFEVTTDYLLCRCEHIIKTIIADPSDFLRSNLKPLLEKNGCVVLEEVGNYNNLIDTLDQYKQLKLLTYEIGANEEEGLKYLKMITEKYPDLKIIVISGRCEQSILDKAIAMGICGYVTKPFREEHISPLLKLLK